jgi:ankyrin repeat protein
MPIILMSLLASMSLGSSALAGMVPAAGPEQSTQSCQTSNPRLERLASAIQRGEIDYVRTALDQDVDVNETWRDLPPQICLSLLLRSIRYSQDEIFALLLKRGADPRSLPRESLGGPVHNGRVAMVRTLLALGLKPHDNNEIVREGLESHNVAMLDLLASSACRSMRRACLPGL